MILTGTGKRTELEGIEESMFPLQDWRLDILNWENKSSDDQYNLNIKSRGSPSKRMN